MFSAIKYYMLHIVSTIAIAIVLSATYSYYKYENLLTDSSNTISNLKIVIEDKQKEINRLNMVIDSDTFSSKWEVNSKLPVTVQPKEVTYDEIKHIVNDATTITF